MQLTIRHPDESVKHLRFRTGPIYIGRQVGSQVLLRQKAVSRQHAVIFVDRDGLWVIEDLDSANKTYLNNNAVHKAHIKDGDNIQICDYIIEVSFQTVEVEEVAFNLEDTLIQSSAEIRTITRKLSSDHSGPVKMPSSRMRDFARAAEKLDAANSPEQLVELIIELIRSQFHPLHVWVGLRDAPEGPMTFHAGRSMSGTTVTLKNVPLEKQVARAVDHQAFILVPRIPSDLTQEKIRSAVIAPILQNRQCFGVIYVDNPLDHEQYDITSLNYIMLLSIYIAAVLRRLNKP